MNISIIDSCNNNCEFCFQGSHKNNNKLNISDIDKILTWYNYFTGNIGLIGGEPTLHPDFIEICKLCTGKGYVTDVFTNLLCSKNIIKEMFKIYGINFLINICHEDNKEKLFINNYKLLINRDWEQAWNCNSAIFLGLTITNDSKFNNKNIERLYTLLKQDTKHLVKGIRLSHAIPNNNDYKPVFNFGEICETIITKCTQINPQLTFSFDCAVNQCIMNSTIYNKLKLCRNIYNLRMECEMPVMDIATDFTTNWCACYNNKYNIWDYKNPVELYNQLIKDKFIANKCNNINCDYKNCINIECPGFCHGINNYL